MVDDIRMPLEFTFTELIRAVVFTVLIVMLVNFGTRMELLIGHNSSDFPQGGKIAKLFIFFISAIIAYNAYAPILFPHLGDLDWIYSLIFLVFSLVVLAQLGNIIYNNTEFITALINRQGVSLSSGLGVLTCEKCETSLKKGTRFCSYAVQKLISSRFYFVPAVEIS